MSEEPSKRKAPPRIDKAKRQKIVDRFLELPEDQKQPYDLVAKEFDISVASARNIVKAYKIDQGLIEPSGPSAKSKLQEEQLHFLRGAMAVNPNVSHERLKDLLLETYPSIGNLSASTVGRTLKEMGYMRVRTWCFDG